MNKETKLSDVILLSDIDGTLTVAPKPVPARNIEALERFTKEGGRFGLATGRSVASARPYADLLPVNGPCIIHNGCCVYDYVQEKMLHVTVLPESFRGYLKSIIETFPEIGVTLFDETTTYSVANRTYSDKFLGVEKVPILDGDLDALPGPFVKSVFSVPPEFMPEVMTFIDSQPWEDVQCLRSATTFYEMLPKGVTKGSGILEMSRLLEIPIENIVAIGDYYNDEKMLRTVGFPVTVKKAPDEIKAICSLIVGDCMDGALADLVEYLEETCLG